MSTIKIAIADDYQIYRDGLKVGLSADEHFEVIIEADNGRALLQEFNHQVPDVVLMDLKMPVMDGLEATRRIRQQYPGVKILMISMYEDDKFLLHAIAKGAHGYLLKNTEPEELRRSVYGVLANGYYFGDGISGALLREIVSRYVIQPVFRDPGPLTVDEKNLLLRIKTELTLEEPPAEAEAILRSPLAVQMREKIGAFNRAGLILYAIHHAKMN